MKVTTDGLDLTKQVFSVHGVNERGKPMELFAKLAPSPVGMEACSGVGFLRFFGGFA